jgi:hypothetical protein
VRRPASDWYQSACDCCLLYVVRTLIGVVARLIVYAGFIVIVGDALLTLWERGEYALAVAAAVFFPLTVLFWPWRHDAFGASLIWVFIATVIAYPISTFVGRLDPI